MYIRLYSSHSNRRNDTHASGNVGRTVKREHTGAFTWHFFYQFSGFIFFSFFSHSVFISSPSLTPSSLFYFSPTSDSPPPLPRTRVDIYALTYKSGHFGKIDTSYHCGLLEI